MDYVIKTEIIIRRVNGRTYTLDYVNDVEIKSSWAELSDKATISIPIPTPISQSIEVYYENYFNVGDHITVNAWYRGYEKETRFEGYIKAISATIPIVLECECPMYLMGKFHMTKDFQNVTLGELVDYVFEQGAEKVGSWFGEGNDGEGITYYKDEFKTLKPVVVSPDTNLGVFLIDRATGTMVFDELKKKYGLSTYTRGKEFHIGFSYTEDIGEGNTKEFFFEENIVSDNLVYKRANEIQMKVKAISIMDEKDPNTKKNIKHSVELGDADGDLRTLHFHNVPPKELVKMVGEEISKYKFDGYRGSFTGFLHPVVKHSHPVKIAGYKVLERKGTFMISEVVTKISPSLGARQIIKLDRIFANEEEYNAILSQAIVRTNEKIIKITL